MVELPVGVTAEHIRQSNWIEGIDDPVADEQLAAAWTFLADCGWLDLDVLLHTHWLVTRDQLGDDAGRLREVGVRVGSRICPPPEQVSGMVADWLHAMQWWAELDPKTAHVEFERIHPFRDGNGRVGRCLLWLHQVWLGQEPILLWASERQDYYRWFRRPGDNDTYRRHLRALLEEEETRARDDI